jgi:alpha-L-fucosidase
MGQRRTDRASCQGQRSARDTRRHGTSTGQPLGPSRRMASARTGAVIPCALLTLATMLAVTPLLAQSLPPVPAVPGPDDPIVIAKGPFQPTDDSFAQYRYPEWFRDAKLGFWAHWGPQAVPMFGDWYARNMYKQGSKQYEDHLKRYGHPSKEGWKDVIPLWKAERWDPDRLMALYRKAGARYFVSMGVHHDNFDLWSSKYHRWNAVQMGPHRDVVGDWQKAAKAAGLPFGVSEHLGASFTWWQDSHGSDKTGPLAGVPYDGADPRWQDLYHPPAAPGDTQWYSTNPAWQREWLARIQDLVDHYQPDLLYTDGAVPFGNQIGRSLIAHLYNTSAARHGGQPQVVYTCKQDSHGMWVQDVERGVLKGISQYPWQTDTSIGDWFYNRTWKYRSANWVIDMLVDVVSKNGNLLINIVQRPDGTLDPEVEQLLGQMADWIATNGEGIYGTRPWTVFGEGPVRAEGGAFKENAEFTAEDVRFTTKGDTLYAFVLGWPKDSITIRALGTAAGHVTGVRLLGHGGALQWNQEAAGLTISLPEHPPCDYAVAFAISGMIQPGLRSDAGQ